MRGKILGVDRVTGKGQISGDDGQRYQFGKEDWSAQAPPAIGALVDFEVNGKDALSVFRVDNGAVTPATAHSEKSKIVAALLAFFLGPFGVHKFYLGYNGAGIAMLSATLIGFVLSIIIIGIFVVMGVSLVAFIEFIIYLVTSDEDFQEKYVRNSRPWF
ncbi:MAG: TM2 domain-containing protein [Pseudomonadota bacterium]